MRFDQLPPEYRGSGIKIALTIAVWPRATGNLVTSSTVRSPPRANNNPGRRSNRPRHACGGILTASPGTASGMRRLRRRGPSACLQAPARGKLRPRIGARPCVEAVSMSPHRFRLRSAIGHRRATHCGARKRMAMIALPAAPGTGCNFRLLAPGIGSRWRSADRHLSEDSLHAWAGGSGGDGRSIAAGSGLFVPPSPAGTRDRSLRAGRAWSPSSPDALCRCDGTSLAARRRGTRRAGARSRGISTAVRQSRWPPGERLFSGLKGTAQPLGDPQRTAPGCPMPPRALGLQLQSSSGRSPTLSLAVPSSGCERWPAWPRPTRDDHTFPARRVPATSGVCSELCAAAPCLQPTPGPTMRTRERSAGRAFRQIVTVCGLGPAIAPSDTLALFLDSLGISSPMARKWLMKEVAYEKAMNRLC